MSIDDGMRVAVQFFALGLLWLFIAAFIVGIFQAVRNLVG